MIQPPPRRKRRLGRRGAIATALCAAIAAMTAFASLRPAPVEPPKCVTDVTALIRIVRSDYAGYADKVRGHSAALDTLTRRVTKAAAQTSDEDEDACDALVWRWLAFFHDRHLGFERVDYAVPAGAKQQAQPVTRPELRPSVTFLDDSTALLRVPTFDLAYKPLIDSVLSASRSRLVSTPKLVIDLRGNSGGGDESYSAILPLIETGAIHVVGVDVLAAPGTRAYYEQFLSSPELSDTVKAMVRDAVARMARSPGRFVPLDADTTLTFAQLAPGIRAVGILVDGAVASSAEQFLLAAHQSAKVRIFGRTRTAGALDYANVREVSLPGVRELRLPTSRTRRTGTDRVDPDGIAPDIVIPSDSRDDVAYVRGILTGGGTHVLGALDGSSAPLAPAQVRPRRMIYEEIASRFGSMNALNDHAARSLAVYLPPDYDLEPTRRFPVLYLLQSGRMPNFAWVDGTFRDAASPDDTARGLHVQVALDTLIRQHRIPEMIVVMPDGRDALGASWYANSPATGFWEDYLLREIVPYVDSAYRTIPNRASRGIAGHSLGGFGAMRLAMRHPDVFGAVYAMSPCCLAWEGEIGFTSPVWRQTLKVTSAARADTLSAAPWALYTAALAFSPDTARRPLLADWPVHVVGDSIAPADSVAKLWLDNSPLADVGRDAAALRSLRAIGFDAGDRDALPHIPRTVRELADSLQRLGVAHEWEIFHGGHEDHLPERVTTRMLPFMGRALAH